MIRGENFDKKFLRVSDDFITWIFLIKKIQSKMKKILKKN